MNEINTKFATFTPAEKLHCFEFFQEWIAERIVRSGDAVIDVGANVGGHTWTFLQLVGESGCVVAIEPNPGLNANLQKWCEIHPNLMLLDVALSNQDGELDFNIPAGDQGYGSLWTRPTHDVEFASTVKVPVTTLDCAFPTMGLESIRLMKVDIEGSELRFLEGAQDTLRRLRPWITIEVDWGFSPDSVGATDTETANWNRLSDVVRRAGYRVFTLLGEELSAPDNRHHVILLAPQEADAGAFLAEEAGDMLDAYRLLDGSWKLGAKFEAQSPFHGRLARAMMLSTPEEAGSVYERERFDRYVADMPLLQSWDGGETWNSGSFTADYLRQVHDFIRRDVGTGASILETGAGNSTIAFLHLYPNRVVSICPEPSLFDRIEDYCRNQKISLGPAEFIDGFSEWELPKLANFGATNPLFDFALIDGHHGWPNVFVDFFYVNYLLKERGCVMIGNVQLNSIAELMRLLDQQPSFERVLDIGKSVVYRRIDNERSLPDWAHQPYIAENS
ncbi:FkbM family methyltransferase [Shimia isoporae]|uniref:FkbM family methyltransferase n=2 Tax=Shimia isoporae TaxID=647720 RepID=A0A4R1N4G8_9RHOB|nr:FkbM family methyltransferase [Shimia isoporae]